MGRKEKDKLFEELMGTVTRGSSALKLEALTGRISSALDGAVPKTDAIRIADIEVRPQVRKSFDEEEIASLAESIKEHGLLQPIIVVEKGDGRYLLVAGERRLRAAKKLGWFSIPAIVIPEKDEGRLKVIQLVENLQRKDLSLMEKAEGIRDYFDLVWGREGGSGSPNLDDLWLTFYYMNGGKRDRIKGRLELYQRVASICGDVLGMPATTVLLFYLVASLPEKVKSAIEGFKNISATHLRILLLNRRPSEMDGEIVELLEGAEEKGMGRREFERLLRGRLHRGSSQKSGSSDPFAKVDRFMKGLIKGLDDDLKRRVLKYIISKAEAALIKIDNP